MRKQYKYGYSVFLNINICRNNLEDVRKLTELAHDSGIATDYHICETPMMEQQKFQSIWKIILCSSAQRIMRPSES